MTFLSAAAALAFVFGLCIGSFLNVCIYRLPAARSIVSPPSACLRCGYRLRFYDNIPVLSWLWLRGKCRSCKAPISVRYPLVELLTGLLAAASVLRFGLQPAALAVFAFLAVLVVVAFIDLDHQIIPDVLTLPGILLFFFAGLALPEVPRGEALIGALASPGALYLVGEYFYFFRGVEGLGGGDVKLISMIGALLGWPGVVVTIFLASAAGTLAGLAIMIRTGKGTKLAVPFGPFLAVGAAVHVFFGAELIAWYLQTMR
jgi:leader peptidase (prepilin peptidase)/N-methyltransferase